MPEPVPPSVNEGRMISGKPSWSAAFSAASSVVDQHAARHVQARPCRMASLNQQAVFRHLDGLERRADQLHVVACPGCRFSASSTERLSAVWPPTVGSSASGRSRAMIASRYSAVSGSM